MTCLDCESTLPPDYEDWGIDYCRKCAGYEDRVARVISVEAPRWTRLRGWTVERRREVLRQVAEKMAAARPTDASATE